MESKSEGKSHWEDKGGDPDQDDKDLIAKVQEYFFGNDQLAHTFEDFVRRRCSIVDLSSEEFKLEYTTAFEDYKALFEDYMEGFITRDCSSSVRNFYEALKRQMDKDENSSEAVFGQILIAVTDFDIFMTMMREAKQSGETDSRK